MRRSKVQEDLLAQKIMAVGSASVDASISGVALAELVSDHAKGDFEMSCPMAALDLKVCQMIVDHVRAVDEAKVLVLQTALSRCASDGEKLLHAFTQRSGGKAMLAISAGWGRFAPSYARRSHS